MSLQRLVITGLIAGACNTAVASGFALSGKSTSGLGYALSGTTVMADDASVVYNNPAAMRDLDGETFTALLHVINTNVEFTNEGSTTTGTGNKTVKKNHFVPNLYYVKPLNEDVSFGLGLYSPFGLGIEYGDDWVGRYHSINSSLRTINLSPALAFSPSDKLNLGIGVDFQYAEAELSKALDFSAIGGAPDGTHTLTGNSWALGYSLGLTYDLSEATRLGASFHSSTRQDLKGESNFEGVPNVTVPSPIGNIYLPSYYSDSDASLTLMLPESLSLGMRHAVTPKLEVLADYTWMRWSRYDETVVDFSNSLPNSTDKNGWRDSNRYAIGMNYRMRENVQLRGGVTYDQTPVPSAELRSPRTPDADKVSVGLGSKVGLSSGLDIDMALFYTLPVSTDINNTDSSGHTLKGSFDTQSTYLSMQLSWKL